MLYTRVLVLYGRAAEPNSILFSSSKYHTTTTNKVASLSCLSRHAHSPSSLQSGAQAAHHTHILVALAPRMLTHVREEEGERGDEVTTRARASDSHEEESAKREKTKESRQLQRQTTPSAAPAGAGPFSPSPPQTRPAHSATAVPGFLDGLVLSRASDDAKMGHAPGRGARGSSERRKKKRAASSPASAGVIVKEEEGIKDKVRWALQAPEEETETVKPHKDAAGGERVRPRRRTRVDTAGSYLKLSLGHELAQAPPQPPPQHPDVEVEVEVVEPHPRRARSPLAARGGAATTPAVEPHPEPQPHRVKRIDDQAVSDRAVAESVPPPAAHPPQAAKKPAAEDPGKSRGRGTHKGVGGGGAGGASKPPRSATRVDHKTVFSSSYRGVSFDKRNNRWKCRSVRRFVQNIITHTLAHFV